MIRKSSSAKSNQDYDRGSKSLRFKMFSSNLIVMFLALALFCGVFLQVSTDNLQKQTLRETQTTLDQAAAMLEEQTSAFRGSIDSLSLDEANVSLLNRDNRQRYRSVTSWNEDYVLLEKRIESLLFRSKISRVEIVTDNAISSYKADAVLPLKNAKKTKWYRQVMSSKSSCTWSKCSDLDPAEGNDTFIVFTRNLPYEYQSFKSFYVGYIRKEDFSGLSSASLANPYASCYVVNSTGECLFGNAESQAAMERLLPWVDEQYRRSENPIPVQSVQIGGEQYFVGSCPIYNTDLKLIYSCAFFAQRGDSIRQTLLSMGLIAILITPLILLFSIFISRSVTRPLEQLRINMMTISRGKFDMPLVPPSSDREVRALTRCFNYMALKISDLLDKQYQDGKRIKDLELRSLQAQINPHFLYNTLDLIKWKAAKAQGQDVQNLVNALSNYYRSGLSKGADIVPLKTELEHVRSYVYIQNMRFDNCIRLKIEASESCLACLLPKLTLQPLVENAITHGILESEAGQGGILIRTFPEKGRLCIAVVDDGCGMPAGRAANIVECSDPSPDAGSGYGLRNINERIRLLYGEAGGLSFVSYPNRGTAALLTIPVQTEEKNHHV
ncbi:MAG: sensor histidine kinase [Clostridiales bacterium]|jgi:two-component system sensor histidine kinase YesM|nr:sensor histidine kinase [Clostridiales bacterium]